MDTLQDQDHAGFEEEKFVLPGQESNYFRKIAENSQVQQGGGGIDDQGQRTNLTIHKLAEGVQ